MVIVSIVSENAEWWWMMWRESTKYVAVSYLAIHLSNPNFAIVAKRSCNLKNQNSSPKGTCQTRPYTNKPGPARHLGTSRNIRGVWQEGRCPFCIWAESQVGSMQDISNFWFLRVFEDDTTTWASQNMIVENNQNKHTFCPSNAWLRRSFGPDACMHDLSEILSWHLRDGQTFFFKIYLSNKEACR